MEKVTINDIARLTGLSKGTVDRVLHNRGEVSKKSYEKVMACIREMGYEPNVYASLLAGKGKGSIAVVLPRPEEGSYWELASSGIGKAEESGRQVGVHTQLFTYNEFSADSFRETCATVLDSKPSGVVIAPMFQYETQVFVQELSGRGIPYVFVDTKLECSCRGKRQKKYWLCASCGTRNAHRTPPSSAVPVFRITSAKTTPPARYEPSLSTP